MTNEELALLIDYSNHTNDINKIKEIAIAVAKSQNPYHICDFAEFCKHSDHPEIMPILENGMFATGGFNSLLRICILYGRPR